MSPEMQEVTSVELPTQQDLRQKEEVRRAVLVVEDDPSQRELLVEVLADWGYEPVAVGSAEEADYLIRRRQLDAAVVDLILPGRNGAVLLAKLRTRYPQAVLIGISAMDDGNSSRRLKGVGADQFIGKPLKVEELANALKALHHTWH